MLRKTIVSLLAIVVITVLSLSGAMARGGFGGGGLIVLLGLLQTLSGIDNTFNAFLVNIFRLLPILVGAGNPGKLSGLSYS